MNLFNIPIVAFQFFLLIFIRIWGLMFFAPIFSHRSFPVIAKAGFSLFVSIILYPHLQKQILFSPPSNTVDYFMIVLWQLIIGFSIGFTIKLVFEAVQLAGEVVGFQMGFAIVNVMDPQGSSQIPLLAMVETLFATLLFLVIDAHHWTLKVIVKSFSVLPFDFKVAGKAFEMVNFITTVTGEIFIIAIKLAAPPLAILLFINVGLGIVARTVPQINIFIVGFPIQIALGFFILSAALSVFGKVFMDYGSKVHHNAYQLIKIMR